MFTVAFFDLSEYADNVVYAPNAKVYDVVTVPTMVDAMDLAMDFSSEFQIAIDDKSLPTDFFDRLKG
jgi:hypothetical protein